MNNYVRSNEASEIVTLFRIKISIDFQTYCVKIHEASQLVENRSLSLWLIIQNWHLTVVQLHLHFHYREHSFWWQVPLICVKSLSYYSVISATLLLPQTNSLQLLKHTTHSYLIATHSHVKTTRKMELNVLQPTPNWYDSLRNTH